MPTIEETLILKDIDCEAWAWGIGISLIGGAIACTLLTLTWRKGWTDKDYWSQFIPTLFMGFFERIFFTLGVAFGLSGIAIGMVAFVSAKMAAGWNGYKREDPGKDAKQQRMSALAGGIVSILFGTIGGLICAGRIALGE